MSGSMRRLARYALVLGLLVAGLGPLAPWATTDARAEALPASGLAAIAAPERALESIADGPAAHFGFNRVLDQVVTSTCVSIGAQCRANLTTVGLPSAGGPLVEIGLIVLGPCSPLGSDNCVNFTVTGSFTLQAVIGPAPPFLIPGDIPTLRVPVVDAFGNVSFRDFQCGTVGPDGRSTCNHTNTEAGLVPLVGNQVEVRVARNTAIILPPVANIPPPPLEFIPQPPPPPLLPPGPPVPPLQGAGQGGPMAPARYPAVPVIPEADSMLLLLGGLAAVGAFGWWRRTR